MAVFFAPLDGIFGPVGVKRRKMSIYWSMRT